MKRTVLLLTAFLINTLALGCINSQGLNIFGEKKEHLPYDFDFSYRTNLLDWKKRLAEKENEFLNRYKNKYKGVQYINDLAVIKIYQGQYQEAIQLLNSILPTDSLQYSIHSNLGVAHELTGNIDSAYYYTSKAVRINKNAHFSSEWIHLRILEASKKGKMDKRYVYNNYIIGGKISKDSLPANKFMLAQISEGNYDFVVLELIRQLEYQLTERMLFVKPENPMVANLLFTLADLYATEIDYNKARVIYNLAKKYDSNFERICNMRLGYIAKLLHQPRSIVNDSNKINVSEVAKIISDSANKTKAKTKTMMASTNNKFNWWYFIIPGAILIGIIGAVLFKRNKKSRSSF